MPRQGEDPAFVKRVRDFGSEEGGIAVQGQRRISVRAKYCRVSDRGLTPESDSATCHRTFAFAAHQYEAALRPLGSEGCTTTARVPGSVGDDASLLPAVHLDVEKALAGKWGLGRSGRRHGGRREEGCRGLIGH